LWADIALNGLSFHFSRDVLEWVLQLVPLKQSEWFQVHHFDCQTSHRNRNLEFKVISLTTIDEKVTDILCPFHSRASARRGCSLRFASLFGTAKSSECSNCFNSMRNPFSKGTAIS
jgi:hypothetical protein